MVENDRLTPKQERLVAALLSESTIGGAAAYVGISEITAYRWLRLPAFVSAYRAACRQVVDAAIGRLQAACGQAVEALQDIMADPDASASARVSAARCILDMSFKAVEIYELEERVRALEELTYTRKRRAA